MGAVEVKLGTKAIDDEAKALLKLKDKIKTNKMNGPSFIAVITATGYAYQRPDGVYVISIVCKVMSKTMITMIMVITMKKGQNRT